MSRRWLAFRVTGELIYADLPVEGEPDRRLSASGSLTLTLTTEAAMLMGADGWPVFGDSWSTIVVLEEAERIRWCGITISSAEEGSAVEVELGSFTSYLYGQAWVGEYSAVNIDPATVLRAIVAHVQSFADGDLGLEVVGSTSARLGTATEERDVLDENGEPVKDAAGETVKETVPVPYELNWWDNPECGEEIDRIVTECGIEWVEEHEWLDRDAGTMRHLIRVADRIGGRRDDLRFEDGVNIAVVPSFDEDGDEYASEIHALGAGEGRLSLRSTVAVNRPRRLRRAKFVDETKDVHDKKRLDTIATLMLRHSAGLQSTDQIVVVDHTHAPLGAWGMGDEVLLDLRDAGGRWTARWYRIVGEQMVTANRAVLDVIPSL